MKTYISKEDVEAIATELDSDMKEMTVYTNGAIETDLDCMTELVNLAIAKVIGEPEAYKYRGNLDGGSFSGIAYTKRIAEDEIANSDNPELFPLYSIKELPND